MKKTIKGYQNYYALLCYCSDGDPTICGVYATRKEAEEVNKDVKDCPAKHRIVRCKIEIKI